MSTQDPPATARASTAESEPAPPPREPSHRGYMLRELIIVTLGVLIALSVDGVRGYWKDRQLVADARQNLAAELGENRKQVAEFIASLPKQREQLRELDRQLDLFARREHPKEFNFNLGLRFPSLSNASFQTAESTSVFALMDYAEVQRLHRAYAMQRALEDLQGQTMPDQAGALPLKDPATATPEELQRSRDAIARLLRALLVLRGGAGELMNRYDAALAP